MPVAGKTGTTQNWTDAWTIGYTPYYTTSVWFGFDRLGNSLGISQTGAALAAPVWGDMMRELHIGLPQRNWVRPSGIVDVTVCRKSGRLRNSHCNEGAVTLPFMVGTSPGTVCTVHGDVAFQPRIASTMFGVDDSLFGLLSPLPPLPDIFSDFQNTQPNTRSPEIQEQNNSFLDDDISDNTTSPVNVPGESNSPAREPVMPAITPDTTRFVPYNENDEGSDLPSWNPLD
jgi:penicillin-binding protein 1A